MDANHSCSRCSSEPFAPGDESSSTGFFVLVLSLTLILGGLVAMGVISFDGLVELLRR
ncbi:MAG: hypothetical protein H6713_19665 [Myxococcales bacterium]|nr:hypothetical protein [Myxococcales bacterium]MCB9752188.1 hypothetical protein [Myxococcales bacterium]